MTGIEIQGLITLIVIGVCGVVIAIVLIKDFRSK